MAGEPLSLTDRDRSLVRALVRRVRVFSVAQVARTWWPDASDAAGTAAACKAAAEKRLEALAAAGLLVVETFLARPELELDSPLAAWQPGLAPPDFAAVAYRAKSRWTEPAAAVRCVVATAEAGERLGGRGGRFPRQTELTHDLHLAAVYLRMRAELPTRARTWVREDALERLGLPSAPGEKIPDAVVRDGLHRTAVEFAGAYSREKLAAFHRYCDTAELSYELW